jgi:hypothetical protein
LVKRIDPKNKIRYEKNVIKKRVDVKKTISKELEDSNS